jgi:hypothetical protein
VILSLQISLLGDLVLVSGEIPVITLTVPRARSLLAYLVVHRSAAQDRSHLAFLFWPDSTEAQAHTEWAGLWPLIGLAATTGQLALAMDYVGRLLAPTQQRPPEILLAHLDQVVQAWDAGHPEKVYSLLQHVMSLVQAMGYL